MTRVMLILAIVGVARTAAATGGYEIDEQSAAGVGMAGAQTAVANDPAAIFYNPGGLGFQPGFGALVGGHVIISHTEVSPDRLSLWYATALPTVFIAQRFGKFISLGAGLFTNYGEHFSFPPTWRGRFVGYFVDLRTVTVQPTLAVRPLSWLSIGVGLDIIRGAFDTYRALNFGGADGTVHAAGDGYGIGGSVGVMLRLIPRYLNLGFVYRSRSDIDFEGPAATTLPPELAAMQPGPQRARVTVLTPHNFAVGMAALLGHLIVSAEAKVSLWREQQQLTLTLVDPVTSTPMPTMPANATTTITLPLNLHNAWAVRAGAQYGLANDRVRLRVGAGYDASPVPESTLGPLLPDTDRVVASAGIGLHWQRFSVDVAYMGVFLMKRTSKDPNLIATYETFGSVISASATFTLENVLQRHRLFEPPEE
jgi:long-chain fatty acid transport protein